MAKHIKIGQPVNAAETWAFEFLEDKLPHEYLLITNVEIPTPTGVLKEVDALVFGKYAIYLIDVKGYTGRLSVDANSWLLDGRRVDNALSKANGISRVYAGRIRATLLREEHAPWCQGMVFITGHQGSGIEIKKSQENLGVFDANSIVNALTEKEFCTTDYGYTITVSQRRKAIDVLGNIGKVPSKKSNISGFNKIKQTGTDGQIKIWDAVHEQGDLKTEWIVKEVDTTSSTASFDIERLKDQAVRLEQLSGVLGVPVSAPLMRLDEQVALAIRKPRGLALEEFLNANPEPKDVAKILRFALTSIEQIYARGLALCNCDVSELLVSDDCEVTFYTSFLQSEIDAPAETVRRLFGKASKVIGDNLISDWFEDESTENLEVLKFQLARLISGTELESSLEPNEGEMLSGKYTLEERLSTTQSSETWSAKHNDGQFDCVIEIVSEAESRWPHVQSRLSMLMQGFHPSLERIFDVDHIPHNDSYAVSRNWVPGSSLDQSMADADPTSVQGWLRQCLQALQYLHRQVLHHGRVSPQNIICNGGSCTLIGISIFPIGDNSGVVLAQDKHDDALYYEDTTEDLKNIWLSFLSAILGCSPQTAISQISSEPVRKVLGIECVAKVEAFIAEPSALDLGADYLLTFGLKEKERLDVLPKKFAKKWDISVGYMTFITLDLLNDQRPKSRNLIVLNALRSRRIAGNKTNRNSMSATVSRLKSAGVVENYGKKIRLTADFLAEWSKNNQQD
ncbi:NERD domain-containing serine/threonine-protein kinase [Planktomarina temperata]|nr:NERD domain-containing serine/threonine-protein kinase [Planktomarina temperata]